MKVVGITGGIGSGKTTVCNIFELLGVPVFYADVEAKKLYQNPAIKLRVVKMIGQSVLDKHKQINKRKLAKIIFSNKTLLHGVNAIIHPEVKRMFKIWKKKHSGCQFVIREAAIMIESDSYSDIDYLISVISPKYMRINRILKYRNMTANDMKKRINEQLSDKELKKYSDAVIWNDENQSLIKQVLKLHKKLYHK